jgi:hypothetical protein
VVVTPTMAVLREVDSMRTIIRVLASTLLLAGLAAFAPPRDNSIGIMPTKLCGQTGSCIYNGWDICVVNGHFFYGYYWKSATKE